MRRTKSWTRRWARRMRTLLHRRAVERELDEELAFHLEMETEKLRRAGMSDVEARRRARLAFGGMEGAKEGVRDERWLAWAPRFGLDLRLGARMLAKAPGLAIVGGLGMAVAVAISAGFFAVFNSYFFPDLPLHEGDRVVSLVNRDPRFHFNDRRVLHDFVVWRRELRSLADLGAFRTVQRNLIAGTGDVEPIDVAEMTAAGFAVARVAPLLGRTLLESDERPGAPPVLVIGEDVWRERFEGDPGVIGRTMRLGKGEHTIVGVMPEGFAFPVYHRHWVALRVDPDAYPPGSGPALHVFGRLAPGTTHDEAQAELSLLGRRLAAGRPGTPAARLEPLVVPYTDIVTQASAEDELDTYRILRFTIVLLLVVVALNVGVLVYARTMNRSTEIAVRTALGATRRRIVAQLFAEAFVLSSAAALLGLGMVAVGLRWLDAFLASFGTPFWIDGGLSAGTVLHALSLSVLGAVIVGLFPALRATRELRVTIGSSGAGSQARLGRTWTALIVVQVAAAVAILPPALLKSVELTTQSMRPAAFPAREFLTADVVVEPEEDDGGEGAGPQQADAARAERRRATLNRLLARIEEEPAVVGAALATSIPWSGGRDGVEVEGAGRSAKVYLLDVGEGWLELLGVRVVAGRSFAAADAADAASPNGPPRAVIVNRSFVDELLGGGPATGRRVRYQSDDEPQPWLEIVGVVEDFPAGLKIPGHSSARMYHPAPAGAPYADTLTVRLRGAEAAGFAPKLRRIAAAVDPMMQLSSIATLDALYEEEMRTFGRVALGLAIAVGSVLLLSAAGIHALVSFTVNKRHREIGIRAALGANARRILASVLARAAGQVAIGVGVGLALALLADRASGGVLMSGTTLVLVPAAGAFAILVGVLAAAGPARRALRVEPTEAIRAE